MFFRQKRSGKYTYLQIVENRWEDGRSKQRVIVTLGRLDELRDQGQLEGLLRSGAKLSQAAMVLTAQQKGELPVIATKRIGPELIFQRLWSELKIPQVLTTVAIESISRVARRISRLTSRRSSPKPVMTASGCCEQIWMSCRPKMSPYATSNFGWWRIASEASSRFWRRVRSSTTTTKRFAGTCSVVFWRW